VKKQQIALVINYFYSIFTLGHKPLNILCDEVRSTQEALVDMSKDYGYLKERTCELARVLS
jgi:hypothetical protein